MTMNFHRDWPPELRLVSRECVAQPPIQFRVACFSNFIPDMNKRKNNRAAHEVHSDFLTLHVGLWTLDFEDTSSFLFLFRMSVVEDDAVPRFQRRFEAQKHSLAFHSRDFAKINAAFLA